MTTEEEPVFLQLVLTLESCLDQETEEAYDMFWTVHDIIEKGLKERYGATVLLNEYYPDPNAPEQTNDQS